MEDFKVILKFKADQEIVGIRSISLTSGLKKVFGDIELAKVLQDGGLLIICKNTKQQNKALKTASGVQKVSSGKEGCWREKRSNRSDFRDFCGRKS